MDCGAALTAPAQEAIDTLKLACKDPSVDKKKVFRSLRAVQKEKLQVLPAACCPT